MTASKADPAGFQIVGKIVDELQPKVLFIFEIEIKRSFGDLGRLEQFSQAELLPGLLPFIDRETAFALKGGTVIHEVDIPLNPYISTSFLLKHNKACQKEGMIRTSSCDY